MSLRHRVLGTAVLAAVVAGCAAEDLEVVTGPNPNEVTVTTEAVVDDPADEQGSENGTTNNAVLPDDTSTTSSSNTTSSTTEPPPDTSSPNTTSSTEPEGTTPPTNEPAPGQPGTDASAAAQSVTFVNDRRREQGEGDLRVDGELQALAEAWAHQMAADQEMRHNPNLSEQMPSGYYAWGENVAYGFDPAAINQAWWESDGHRANMLNDDYTAIGVGFVVDESGTYWAVQVFGGD